MKQNATKNIGKMKSKEKKAVLPLPAKAPIEKELIFCISLYFGIPPKFNRQSVLFQYYLQQIAIIRGAIAPNPTTETMIVRDWLEGMGSKRELSKRYYQHTTKGERVINDFLYKMVQSIMEDYESGFLRVQQYEKPIKKGSREYRKKINEIAKEMGLSVRMPLRKLSQKEKNRKALKEYEEHLQRMRATQNAKT